MILNLRVRLGQLAAVSEEEQCPSNLLDSSTAHRNASESSKTCSSSCARATETGRRSTS